MLMINFFPLWWKQPPPPAHLLLDALIATTVSGIPIFLIIRQLLHHLIPRKRQVPVQKLGAVLPGLIHAHAHAFMRRMSRLRLKTYRLSSSSGVGAPVWWEIRSAARPTSRAPGKLDVWM